MDDDVRFEHHRVQAAHVVGEDASARSFPVFLAAVAAGTGQDFLFLETDSAHSMSFRGRPVQK
jgi:hypothetical protein